MKTTATIVFAALIAAVAFAPQSPVLEPTYIGSDACIGCHQGMHADIVNEYVKTGHPYKLNPVSGAAPTYPDRGVDVTAVETPAGTTWDDFAFVIGGYGWKARFVLKDGNVWTAGADGQQNLFADPALGQSARVPYHQDELKPYNFGCFQCHTTGAQAEDNPDPNWTTPAVGYGSFREPGIRCEGCHGPGSDHQAGAFTGVLPPNQGDDLKLAICQTCHQRGGISNAIPAKGGYIRHHEQANEMLASQHGNGDGLDLTCASCHNTHVAIRYPEAAGAGMSGLSAVCTDCHGDKRALLNGTDKAIECVDCHMPKASKSALGATLGNGYVGDVSTHIWGINSNPVTRDAMFTADGGLVALDGGIASVTMDFACLGCHTGQDVEWAARYATGFHTANGITTDVASQDDLPEMYVLQQNYPNPFNPTTNIGFSLPETAGVTLKLFDMSGRLMGTIVDQTMPAGNHTVTLNASNFASGVYLYELKAGEFSSAKTMVIGK